jgi:tetratricopeptide (TPR) repeat protein
LFGTLGDIGPSSIQLLAECIKSGKVRYDVASPKGLIGMAAQLRRPIWVPDTRTHPNYIAAEPSTRSELVLPVTFQRDLQAVINLEFETPSALQEDETAWIEAFAGAMGTVDIVDPEQPLEHRDELKELQVAAQYAHRMDNYAQEIDLLSKALKVEPSDALYLARASAYWYEHEYELALADCNATEAARLNQRELCFVRGQILAEMGRPHEALRDLARVIDLPDSMGAFARRARAHALAELGRWQEAHIEIEAAIAAQPRNGWAYFTRAVIHEMQGQMDAAKPDYAIALREQGPPLNALKRQIAKRRLESPS